MALGGVWLFDPEVAGVGGAQDGACGTHGIERVGRAPPEGIEGLRGVTGEVLPRVAAV